MKGQFFDNLKIKGVKTREFSPDSNEIEEHKTHHHEHKITGVHDFQAKVATDQNNKFPLEQTQALNSPNQQASEDETRPLNMVTIFISCKKLFNLDALSKTDPFCRVEIREENQLIYTFVGQTETQQNNLNPEFTKTISINYQFEKAQILKFTVCDYDGESGNDQIVGQLEVKVAKIMACSKGEFRETLYLPEDIEQKQKRGTIILKAESTSDSNNEIVIEAQAELKSIAGWCRDIDFPFLQIERARNTPKCKVEAYAGTEEDFSQDCSDMDMVIVYKTEPVLGDLNPTFKRIREKMHVICNGDKYAFLRFTIKKHNPDDESNLKVYGYFVSTAYYIDKHPTMVYQLYSKPGKPKKDCKVSFKQFTIVEQPSFAEYLRSGWHINMSVAIDYTASNGDPTNEDSLHYISKDSNKPNPYELAMKTVGQIMESYASKKRFAGLGFGGIPNKMSQKARDEGCSHCFNINGQADPCVQGLENLLKLYRQSLMHVELWGPTIFQKLLENVRDNINRLISSKIYHILLILTDGEVHDMRQTVDAIVELSHLPISIIIIGIGDSQFKNMEILDADENDLISSKGDKTERDIVQFVKYNDFKENISQLAEQVLCEVPDQLVSWMMKNDKKPEIDKTKHLHHRATDHKKTQKTPPKDGSTNQTPTRQKEK